ncbi:MAG: transcriptional regulator [Promethearchaeia archaeon]|nr:MAG: transcriptional regulator [Candidatus Lokiarchaeia archaeon]
MEIDLQTISSFFSVLSDETRIKILLYLFKKEHNVNELKEHLGNISLPGVTYQLNILKENKLIKFQQQGHHRYYSLADTHVLHILSDSIQHLHGGESCDETLSCLEEHLDLLNEVKIEND